MQGVAGELAKAVEEARGLQQQLQSTASAAVERLLMERRLWREEVMRLEEEVAECERFRRGWGTSGNNEAKTCSNFAAWRPVKS